MRFRPCIDIHNGKVKQIVGGSLRDSGDRAEENFCSEQNAAYYAKLYRRDGLKGGHIILLNPPASQYYEASRRQAADALRAYPGGLQIGGGVTSDNAAGYIEEGASHVIVTSYIFQGGKIIWEHLKKLMYAVGKEHVVLDLSCRKYGGDYYIVTDRWQTFTQIRVHAAMLHELAGYCDEFLVHGVDAEGKVSGAEQELVRILSEFDEIPVTYAGGIGSVEELGQFRELSGGKLDFTIGSALDLFGGTIAYDEVKRMI